MQLAFVVDRPFEFTGHAERIDGAGIDTHTAKQAARHVHIIFFGITLGGFAGYFRTDDVDHTRGARRFAEVAADALFRAVVVTQEGQHAAVIVGQDAFLVRV